ncbi:OFA family MFS transporter [Maridesulfovibrio hydrothermalis]|uniref:Major facilitator superfamily MFS_1 n=1 Tax=Maridesulfovibrio hydrothermalis AM13 = DSM 14728 TaxID=1121451 RepID=L0RD36_9BACT|nr:OFA family MFS transporter [Maridesulfovibrio hydrothermalis]CCO24669.1 Major facilitator superfamily MFS_1 [Maridesulfovibrio hydrothermalis AM13 = DSM 14728]
MQVNNENRWLIVAGAVLVQLALGGVYAWSVFTPELQAAGWSRVQTQLVFSAAPACIAIAMLFAGTLIRRWGPRRLVVVGGTVLSCGYLAAGLSGTTDFIAIFILIGVVAGSGIGLAYMVPLVVAMRWFPDRKGLITGTVVAGFGLGVMGWVKLADSWGHLLENVGLSNTFTIYGVIIITLIALGSRFMVFPDSNGRDEVETVKGNFSRREMLRSPDFYLVFSSYAACAAAGLMAIGLMKIYPMEVLMAKGMGRGAASVITGTAMGVFFSLANALGRISWGAVSDKLGRKRSVMLLAASQGVWFLLFPQFAGSEWTLYLGATLVGFNFGGNFSLFPTLTVDLFGAESVGDNYPVMNLAFGLGGIIGPTLGGFMGDIGSFPMAFTFCGVMCLCGSFVIIFLRSSVIEVALQADPVQGISKR